MSTSPYQHAADILNRYWSSSNSGGSRISSSSSSSPTTPTATPSSKSGIKNLLYDRKTSRLLVSKVTYAQVNNVIKANELLGAVLDQLRHPQNSGNGNSAPILFNDVQNTDLLKVLLYELVLGPRQSIRGGGVLKRQLLQHEARIRAIARTLQRQQQEKGGGDDAGAAIAHHPRYIRVNTIKTSTQEVVETLRVLLEEQNNQRCYLDPHVPDLLVVPSKATSVILGYATAATGIVGPYAALQNHNIVLQDKSSCFPAYCLVHGFGDRDDDDDEAEGSGRNGSRGVGVGRGDYIDACAAPGNKTSHLAALLSAAAAAVQSTRDEKNKKVDTMASIMAKDNNRSRDGSSKQQKTTTTTTATTIYAFDQDKTRVKTLQDRMEQLVPTLKNTSANNSTATVDVSVHHHDFLTVDPAQYQTVRAILLDPTCSGSGILGSNNKNNNSKSDKHHDQAADKDHEEDGTDTTDSRVDALSRFQIKMLYHAMTAFPSVDRIVYSTCSVNVQENEHVIATVLAEQRQQQQQQQQSEGGDEEGEQETGTVGTSVDEERQWRVVPPRCLSTWGRRGYPYDGLTPAQSDAMIRVDPYHDATNGFFVCCLQRGRKTIYEKGKRQQQRQDPSTTNIGTTCNGSGKERVSCLPVIEQASRKLNLPIYNGQLAQSSPAKVPTPSSSQTPVDLSSGEKRKRMKVNQHGTEGKVYDSGSEKNGDNGPPTASSTGPNPPTSAKRAKKMAWKNRQAQQKRERLQKKKQQQRKQK